MRNNFLKQPSGAPLQTLSTLYVPCWFCTSPPHMSHLIWVIWGSVLLYLQSPKGGDYSTLDDVSCSFNEPMKYLEQSLPLTPPPAGTLVLDKLQEGFETWSKVWHTWHHITSAGLNVSTANYRNVVYAMYETDALGGNKSNIRTNWVLHFYLTPPQKHVMSMKSE